MYKLICIRDFTVLVSVTPNVRIYQQMGGFSQL